MWHSFDHQRGYHPDTFFGGLTDIYRQPKYSYHLFASQRDVSEKNAPMIYIANELTPFSESDVTVFTNCEEIRLIVFEKDTLIQKVVDLNLKSPHPMVTFKNAFDFIDVKNLHRQKKQSHASIVAEGLIDGKVVVTQKKLPSKRPSKIKVVLENNGMPLKANGSDFVRVIAYVTDQDGIVKRLNNSNIRFEIEGEGDLIADENIFLNPRKLQWGSAPILVRSTVNAGKIKIKASVIDEGIHSPEAGELIFESEKSNAEFIYSEVGKIHSEIKSVKEEQNSNEILIEQIKKLEKELSKIKLKEIERGQEQFEGGN